MCVHNTYTISQINCTEHDNATVIYSTKIHLLRVEYFVAAVTYELRCLILAINLISYLSNLVKELQT